jgi:biotin carboxyl carrier protein
LKLLVAPHNRPVIELELGTEGDAFVITCGSSRHEARVLARDASLLCFELDGRVHRAYLQRHGDAIRIVLRGRQHLFHTRAPGASASAAASTDAEPILRANLPGRVQKVLVQEGAAISAGDVLMLIEAMKMENPILAAADGLVSALHVQEGEMVQVGQLLATCDYRPR